MFCLYMRDTLAKNRVPAIIFGMKVTFIRKIWNCKETALVLLIILKLLFRIDYLGICIFKNNKLVSKFDSKMCISARNFKYHRWEMAVSSLCHIDFNESNFHAKSNECNKCNLFRLKYPPIKERF